MAKTDILAKLATTSQGVEREGGKVSGGPLDELGVTPIPLCPCVASGDGNVPIGSALSGRLNV